MSTRRPSSALRIGDAERDRAIDMLREHYAAGRLTKLEHEERTELALRARTGADLDALFADLPLPDPADVDVMRRRRRPVRPVPQAVIAALAATLTLFAIVQLIPVIAAVAIFVFATRFVFGRHCHWQMPRGYAAGRRW